MSDAPFDPTTAAAAGEPDQPSEEEVRAYVAQLRAAPVDQVVAEVVSALLNAAQVKLGRRDGRLLIDLVGALATTGREELSADLLGQVDQALTQLRMAQVEAETQVAAAAAQGQAEPNDLGSTPSAEDATSSPGAPTGDAPQSPPPAQSQPTGKKLWVPGT